MINIVIPGLLLLSGICVYAGVNHLTIALRKPFDRTHFLFAWLCLLVAIFGVSNGWTYRAESVAEHAAALKWNIALAAPLYVLLLWFAAAYSGVRPRRFLVGMSMVLGALFVVNLFQPYSLQYEEIQGIERLRLPWGEELVLPLGRNSLWFAIAFATVLVVYGYLLYAMAQHWRSERRGTTLAMLLATAFFVVMAIEGILVRVGVINFVHLGPFGFLIMIIVMSVAYSRDVQSRLQESESKFRDMAEKSIVGVYLIQDGVFKYVSPKLAEIFGYLVEELIDKKGPKDMVLPEDWHIVEENLKKRISGEVESIHYDFRGITKNEATIYVEVYGTRTTYCGRPAVIGTLLDITERKRAEEEWVFLANITEHAADAIVGLNLDTNIVSWNRGAEMIFGYLSEEIIGKPWSIVVPPEARDVCRERFKKATLEGLVKTAETERVVKDGRQFPAEMTLTALRDEKGDHIGFVAITRDITERKKLEGQLRHAQKMEAIGLLAGGIAHDFNNILSAIMGFGSLVEMNIKEDDPNKGHVKEVLKAGERATHLTQSLLAFSRKQIIDPKPQNFNEIINGVEKFLRRIIGEDIELKFKASTKDLTIFADRGQIEQVLMNLATNARDAMPEGGKLTIETAIIQIDKEYIRNHSYGDAGLYALLSVTDSGMGMDERTRQKIFEPFFTTKEMGRGTGLGLAMVYGIVKQHDGYIDVYSVPERGTTFRIYLPLISLKAKEKITEAPTVYPKGGTETVLVAEDDEAVRKITNELLQRFGYNVIAAVDGEDAIRKFKENKDNIKLLLLDVLMPKKNGKEAYEEIREIQPNIKAIFLSGYMGDLMDKKGILKEGLNFVMKPASPKALLKKVREALDSPQPSDT